MIKRMQKPERSMQGVWRDSATQRFMTRLKNERAQMFMRDREYMKTLRFKYEVARDMQKMFGKIWREHGTDVFQLIAEAHGETWDAEDEEKNTFEATAKKKGAVKPKGKHDDLVAAREESPRRARRASRRA